MNVPRDPVELLARLVAFRSISCQPNLDLIGFVADYLRGYGVESRLVPHADGTCANLYASIGPRDRGGLCLSGHADVVPVAGQPWSSDPFELVERDGRLYGRGSSDMKGFLARMLAAVPALVAEPLAVPIHLAISYDEEIGCVGVRDLLDELARDAARPRALLRRAARWPARRDSPFSGCRACRRRRAGSPACRTRRSTAP